MLQSWVGTNESKYVANVLSFAGLGMEYANKKVGSLTRNELNKLQL